MCAVFAETEIVGLLARSTPPQDIAAGVFRAIARRMCALARRIPMTVHRNRNVYIDLAEYEEQPFSEGYIKAANTLIGDKVLFASAAPFMDFQEQIELYKRLPFTPETLENVMRTHQDNQC